MSKYKLILTIFTILLFSNILSIYNIKACKDIVACGDATAGDYNLLLKVRDPSRHGIQVLCIVPKGYEYTYRYPWTGKPMHNKVLHKYIGVATREDTIPNIVKAGMSLSDTGLAYGDADTISHWINPTRNAWDDFDWMRYACEKANDEDEAVDLLTLDAVKKMHATGVPENLFVVGPNKGVVIEADAFHYKIKEFDNGVDVMTNYPRDLWKSRIINALPISRSFDTVVEKQVLKLGVVRLKSIFGIRIVGIGDDYIIAKPIPFFHAFKSNKIGFTKKINVGERETVGYFSVELLDLIGNKAKVRVCNKYKAWEEEMLKHIQPSYGCITIEDMINWSRIHRDDLNGLRPMCQDFAEYETVAIYKIPKQNYELMSSGWFSPNHACSSIYVPFHICNTDIYEPYKTGEAAELSLELLNEYGHDTLTNSFTKTEEVFLHETCEVEQISTERISENLDISDFLTVMDIGMQRQAWLTEKIWNKVSKIPNQKNKQEIIEIIDTIWNKSYILSLENMKNAVCSLKNVSRSALIIDKIEDIALDISKTRIDAAKVIGKNCTIAEEEYTKADQLIENGEYDLGFKHLEQAFMKGDMSIKGLSTQDFELKEKSNNNKIKPWIYVFFILLAIAVIVIFLKFKKHD